MFRYKHHHRLVTVTGDGGTKFQVTTIIDEAPLQGTLGSDLQLTPLWRRNAVQITTRSLTHRYCTRFRMLGLVWLSRVCGVITDDIRVPHFPRILVF
jgi:hypothetical protein